MTDTDYVVTSKGRAAAVLSQNGCSAARTIELCDALQAAGVVSDQPPLVAALAVPGLREGLRAGRRAYAEAMSTTDHRFATQARLAHERALEDAIVAAFKAALA